jgi:copper(I)-binding protein
VLVLLFLLCAGLPARADDGTGAIMIMSPWAPPSLAGARNGAAYFTLMNHGTAADYLLSLSTPVADRADLHVEEVTNGVMRMRPAGRLALAPGEAISLKPGSFHVMLFGLKQPLAPGDHFPLTLTFEKAGAVTVDTMVAAKPAAGHTHQQ